VENARAVSTRRDVFLDERGAGLRLSVQDVPRLSGLLTAAPDDRVDHAGTDPDPGDPETGRSS
jgi:hypothetical protein